MSTETPTLSPAREALPVLLARARAHRQAGRSAEAEALLEQILRQSPQCAPAHLELGNLRKAQGRYREALPPLREAVRLVPREAAGWLNCGVAHLELGERAAAIDCFSRAIALEPGRPEAHNILGHALLQAGRTALAAGHLEEALRLRPRYAAAHDNLGRVRKMQARAAEAIEHHRAALAETPKASTHSNLLYTLNLVNLPPDQIYSEHLKWEGGEAAAVEAAARRFQSAKSGEPPLLPGTPSRRLRVGYVSPDLCAHAVAFFFEPLLEHHDRSRFEIFCYSDARVPDAVTARLQAKSEHWRETAALADSALLEAIRADGIDILIDLAGHTAGNRLAVFARRAAPVQITWLGYPNTTGVAAMDYRITDEVSDPAGTERWHSERLLRLPGPFSCYRPPEDAPAVGPAPAGAGGSVTFGCFNHIAKLNEPLIHLWAAVMNAVPGSRLLLKSRGLGDAATVADLRRRFLGAGIAGERLEFCSDELSVRAHLDLYRRVDVALDAFPYNGATTTCEALWMGVPVVTLAGQTHVARVGASLLTSAGFPEWVAGSMDEYVRIARGLASKADPDGESRCQRRETMRGSPLCDAARYARDFERALILAGQEKIAASPDGSLSV